MPTFSSLARNSSRLSKTGGVRPLERTKSSRLSRRPSLSARISRRYAFDAQRAILAQVSDSHNRHFVTRALGMGEQITVHLREEEVRVGDVYLLCTDGLNALVAES